MEPSISDTLSDIQGELFGFDGLLVALFTGRPNWLLGFLVIAAPPSVDESCLGRGATGGT